MTAFGKRLNNRYKKRAEFKIPLSFFCVGVTGFEPATTWSQTRCATGLRYAPIVGSSIVSFDKCKGSYKKLLMQYFYCLYHTKF